MRKEAGWLNRAVDARTGVVSVWDDEHIEVLVLLNQRVGNLHAQREVDVLVHLAVDQQQLADQVLGVCPPASDIVPSASKLPQAKTMTALMTNCGI